MSSKYFYHGIKEGKMCFIPPVQCIDKMIKIIESGGLKSSSQLGKTRAHTYNGLDYISLCRIEDMNEYCKHNPTAFFHFIFVNFCFVISDEVEALKTKQLDTSMYRDYFELECIIQASNERYSDMFDEWQVYKEIPLKYIIGIGIPSIVVNRFKYDSEFMTKLEKLENIAQELNLDIVDTSSVEAIEEFEKNKKEKSIKL